MEEYQINVLFYTGLTLSVATYAKYILKYSMKEFFKLLFSEFRDLLALDIGPKSINALGIVVSTMFLMAALVIPKFTALVSTTGSTDSGSLVPYYAAAAMILFGAILCVRLVDDRAK